MKKRRSSSKPCIDAKKTLQKNKNPKSIQFSDQLHAGRTKIATLISCSFLIFCAYLFNVKNYEVLNTRIRGGSYAGTNFKRERESIANDTMHIIFTRFMQHQGHLIELGRSRVELFKSFCLPTMVHQKNSNFIWVILTDPDLNDTIASTMMNLIKPYPNFLFVKSNRNSHGWWSDDIAAEELQDISNILSGDVELARNLHDESAKKRVVLATTLDADDGLHVDYIDNLQIHGSQLFLKTGLDSIQEESDVAQRWFYSCSSTALEWYPDKYDLGVLSNPTEDFLINRKEDFCIASGITIGYAKGIDPDTIPFVKNSTKLHESIKICKNNLESECLWKMDNSRNPPAVVRAKSLASASLRYIQTQRKDEVKSNHLWFMLQSQFQVQKRELSRVRNHFQNNAVAIVRDNLKGQCTEGHHCDNGTKIILEKFLLGAKKTENGHNVVHEVIQKGMRDPIELSCNLRSQNDSPPPSSSPLPLPIINLGFLKAGTQSLHNFFKCGGLVSGHYNLDYSRSKPINEKYIGTCMKRAVSNGQPPLKTCGNYDAFMQIDYTSRPESNQKQPPCYWPQVEALKHIHAESPNATFLLNYRDFDHWFKSVSNWGTLLNRMARCNMTGFPSGVGASKEELKRFFCDHIKRIRDFVSSHPSHALVEVDIEHLYVGKYLSDRFGVKEDCWGHTHVTDLSSLPKYKHDYNVYFHDNLLQIATDKMNVKCEKGRDCRDNKKKMIEEFLANKNNNA